MYSKTTKGIKVTVTPQFLDHESNPGEKRYVWSYHVVIENEGPVRVRLLSRKWITTDGYGLRNTSSGIGVVGEQPYLEPGESFEYSSGVPLRTNNGFMRGYFYMVNDFDETIEVEIPTFSLDSPYESRSVH